MNIKIHRQDQREIEDQQIHSWPVWTCEISEFDWFYPETEICLILEGNIEVTTDQGVTAIRAGDFVEFPKGLKCRWNVISPVRKHYSFK